MALSDFIPRPSARRRMNMFYLLDTSGSMRYKDCIGSVNRAMPEIVDILREISESNHDRATYTCRASHSTTTPANSTTRL